MDLESSSYKIVALGSIRLKSVSSPKWHQLNLGKTEKIEMVWQEILNERKGRVFNGSCFNFCELFWEQDVAVVQGEFINYKEFLVDRRRPELGLEVKPVAVSGFTIIMEDDTEYVLFGNRSMDVSEYPAFLEFVPSGGIELGCLERSANVNYKLQLLKELEEETGVSSQYVDEMRSFTLIYDCDHRVFDIGCIIRLNVSREYVISQKTKLQEYQEISFVKINALNDFINLHRSQMVPSSLALAEAFLTKEFNLQGERDE